MIAIEIINNLEDEKQNFDAIIMETKETSIIIIVSLMYAEDIENALENNMPILCGEKIVKSGIRLEYENKYDEYFKKTQNILTLNNDDKFDSLSLIEKIKKLNSLCNEGKELVQVFIDSHKKSEEVKSLEYDNAEYIKMYNKILYHDTDRTVS